MEYKLGNSLRIKSTGETNKLTCPNCKEEVEFAVYSNCERRLAAKITLFDVSNVYFLVCPKCASVFTVDENKGKELKNGKKDAITSADINNLKKFKD